MANVDCKCQACEEIGRRIDVNCPVTNTLPTFVDEKNLKDIKPEDLTLELEWFKPNGITILPNSKETRITSNTYVFLNIFVMHKQYGQISMDSVFDSQQEPQIKLLSTPEWCSKCNRELLSYSPKTAPFSYCTYSKKLLAKFRIICSSNSHFVDKQLITITAQISYNGILLEKSINNIRINSKKPRDETDPNSFKRRRKRKIVTPQGTILSTSQASSGIVLESLNPNCGTAAGSTLVCLRGQFTLDSEVMFGAIKIKPFMQKSEENEDEEEISQKVQNLLCYSPPGVPGASVQVYVKDGERISESQYFLYTKKDSENSEEKSKVKSPLDEYTAQIIRDLGNKYNQLESVVLSVLQQSGGNSGVFKTCNVNGENLVVNLVLKNVLMDIIQAKATIKDLEAMFSAKTSSAFSPYHKTMETPQGFARQLYDMSESLSHYEKDIQSRLSSAMFSASRGSAFSPKGPANLLDFLPREEIAKENQMLSHKIFSRFAFSNPPQVYEPIPPMRLPYDKSTHDMAYDFGIPTNNNNRDSMESQKNGVGLDKLVAAIETLEQPYP